MCLLAWHTQYYEKQKALWASLVQWQAFLDALTCFFNSHYRTCDTKPGALAWPWIFSSKKCHQFSDAKLSLFWTQKDLRKKGERRERAKRLGTLRWSRTTKHSRSWWRLSSCSVSCLERREVPGGATGYWLLVGFWSGEVDEKLEIFLQSARKEVLVGLIFSLFSKKELFSKHPPSASDKRREVEVFAKGLPLGYRASGGATVGCSWDQ